VQVRLHSAGDASPLAALFLSHILAGFPVVTLTERLAALDTPLDFHDGLDSAHESRGRLTRRRVGTDRAPWGASAFSSLAVTRRNTH